MASFWFGNAWLLSFLRCNKNGAHLAMNAVPMGA
jgi:hypothetical protein